MSYPFSAKQTIAIVAITVVTGIVSGMASAAWTRYSAKNGG